VPTSTDSKTSHQLPTSITLTDEVQGALNSGAPIVALESTIISHGLPRPENLRVAGAVEDIVRSRGAIPATIAILDGTIHVGLTPDQLEQVANRDDILKVSVRDLATVTSRAGSGATTVAATSHIAHLVGISTFATGGLGGVHRGARDTWDESADLTTLGNTPVTIVCAGVKSILDVTATLERLETLNVGVVGFGSINFPGFYLNDSGHTLDWSVDDVNEVADIVAMRSELRIPSALIIANPLPIEDQLDPDEHDAVLAEGQMLAAKRGISGKDVTPFLLDHFHRSTHGASLMANEKIVLRNAELAARIAVAQRPLQL
jgi:pseudouridylate synthase